MTYEAFYGMREPAFTLTPNPAFFFVNERTREGVKQIEYGILRREGFTVICGDVGTGKTTLCWALLERLENMRVCTALVQNPMLSATDILKCILHDLGARPKAAVGEQSEAPDPFDTSWMAGMGQMELIERLNAFILQMARKGLFTVVIIDEAQGLSMETLEQLRLLSNLELSNQKLLQIIFVGQLELKQKLERPELRQLNQRVSVFFETKPLSRADTEPYIRHRLRVAWAIPRLRFRRGAFNTIYRLSRGYPRLINLICDRALACAFQKESYVVTAGMVRRGFESIRELSASRIPVWTRRLLPIAAVMLVASLVVVLKKIAPGTSPVSDLAPGQGSPVSAPPNQIKSPEVGSRPAVTSTVPQGQGSSESAGSRPRSEKPTPAPAGQEEFVLQVSSFRGMERARAACRELEAMGMPSFYEYYAAHAGSGWFGIYAGPYKDLAAAMQASSSLEGTMGKAPLLKRRAVR